MFKHSRLWRRLIAMAIGTLILVTFGTTITFGQDTTPPAEEVVVEEAAAPVLTADAVQIQVDSMWILITAFLVFFMQAGFAFLESGMIRQKSVVNSLTENFMDACFGGLAFFAIGYGLALGADNGSGLFGTTNFFLSEALVFVDGTAVFGEGASSFVLAIFQYAFAATAGTIATGAMAERTNFIGKIIYTIIVAAFIYPIVVHWVWGGGWLAQRGFFDFAGSTVVHLCGAIIGLTGAMMLGARKGRVWGKPWRPHNLGLATLGTLILWFGWYGFNPGSTLSMGNPGLVGLVTVNTTLAAAAGAAAAILFGYFRTGKWDLPSALNGSLGGLVGITAGCAFLTPTSSIIVGAIGGVLVLLTIDAFERLKIDDAVGAFAVHGTCGAMGTLAIGFLGQAELGTPGLLTGGGADQLITQIIGVAAISIWTGVAATIMFGVIKALGFLRIPDKAEDMGIDVYEHGATVWPDVLPHPDDAAAAPVSGKTATAGAGD